MQIHGLTFSDNLHQDSWIGQLDESDDEQVEEQIRQFIKHGNPSLYKKLNRLPIRSWDVPPHLVVGNSKQSGSAPTDEKHHAMETSPNASAHQSIPLKGTTQHLDGIGHRKILEAANNLYPDLRQTDRNLESISSEPVKNPLAFQYPSNSLLAKELRARNQREICDTLIEVQKHTQNKSNTNLQSQQMRSRSVSPEVLLSITRPYYIEPSKHRYKKQGMTATDYKHDLKRRKEDGSKTAWSHLAATGESRIKQSLDEDRVCYCREHHDEVNMVRCDSTLCPIVWFHLRCTDLDSSPRYDECFRCFYCREDDSTQTRNTAAFSTTHVDDNRSGCSRKDIVEFPEHLRDKDLHHSNRNTTVLLVDESTTESVTSRHGSTITNDRSASIGHTSDSRATLKLSTFRSHPRFDHELEEQTDDTMSYSEETGVAQCSTRKVSLASTNSNEDITFPESPSESGQSLPNAPRTPPLQAVATPTYTSSKPWGTPINYSSYSTPERDAVARSPVSPSPAMKRKYCDFARDEICKEPNPKLSVEQDVLFVLER